MPKNVVQYDLLISCPGDITTEISIIEDAVSQFNTISRFNCTICLRLFLSGVRSFHLA